LITISIDWYDALLAKKKTHEEEAIIQDQLGSWKSIA
jgi:hypothetical protein